MTVPNPTAARRWSLPTIDRAAWLVAISASALYVVATLIAILTTQDYHEERVYPGLVPIVMVILAALLGFTTRRRATFPLLIAAVVTAYAWRSLYFLDLLQLGYPPAWVPGIFAQFLVHEDVPGVIVDLGFYVVLIAAVAAGIARRRLPSPESARVGEQSDRLSVFAVLALVLSFVIPPVGVILGHIALAELRRTHDRGRGLAIAGLIIGYVWTVGVVVLIVVGTVLR